MKAVSLNETQPVLYFNKNRRLYGIPFFLFCYFNLVMIIKGSSSDSGPAPHYRVSDFSDIDEALDDYCFMHDIDRDDIDEVSVLKAADLFDIDPYDMDEMDLMFLDDEGELIEDL